MNPISLFDQEEFSRWWEQAKHTISSAQRDVNQGDFAWGSFKAQQAAETAREAISAAQKIMTFVEEVINPASSSKPGTKEDH